jgi:succinyl-CoA synthetase beta subunit
LPEHESLAQVALAGIPVAATAPAATVEEAVEAARSFGGPVALKVDVLGLAHKSDAGGVRLGLEGDTAVRDAAEALLALPLPEESTRRGLLVQRMAPRGVELIVGMRRDPQFGPAVIVGLGGVLTEVLDDVAIRHAPVRTDEALAMLDELRGGAVLRGLRGLPPVDRAAVAAIIVNLARWAVERPDLIEVDLNPVVAWSGGALAVDALLVVEEQLG